MRLKWLTAPLALALVLGACGGGGDDTDDPPETEAGTDDPTDEQAAEPDPDADPVTLTVGLFGNFGVELFIDEYEEMNPHVTIELQQADLEPHHDALITAFAAGSGAPDIAAVEVAYIASFAAEPDSFHNLYDYGAAEVEDRYLDWKWEQGKSIDGESVIGLPTDVGGIAMCYRHDLFEEAGLETDREALGDIWGDSWQSFIDFGRDYTEATGRGFIDNQELLWNAVVNQDPSTYYDEDGNPIYQDSEQVSYAWDTVVEAIEAGIIAEIEPWSGEWEAGMSDGTFAVLTCPAWMMGYIQTVAPDTAGLWDMATLPEGGGNWGGTHFTVPEQSEHPQEAFDFISYVLAPEQQLRVFQEVGNFPTTPEIYDTEDIQSFESEFFNNAPVGPIYAENALEVVAQNIGPHYAAIDTEFENALLRIVEGAESPDEAWESAMENIRRETQ